MASYLPVLGWLGETVIKGLIDKVWVKMNELLSHGEEGAEFGLVDAFNNLEISLINIQPTITKAEDMWIKDENLRQNMNKLLVLLKDAAYDAEDLLDRFQFQKLQQQIKLQRNEASDTSLTNPTKKRKVGEDTGQITKIRKIQEKLDHVSITMEKLLTSDNGEKMKKITEISTATSSIPVETLVFGRDDELKELMRLLLEPVEGLSRSESGCNIPVLTITGMGGVGKTTLAQQVYNHKRVEEYFELRIWVCVSEDFNVERLTKEIINSATKQKCDDLRNFDALQVDLKKAITSKKFLLVLDDVWNTNKHIWGNLCAPLRSGITSSKILVTTRDEKIANMVSSVNPIHLNGLDENNCWELFKKCTFGSKDSRDHLRLETIAREMVPKLKGLPLAARTLGGLLNRNMNEEHWRAIMDNEIWKLSHEENGVLLVLQLSYQYLPAHLKRCFAFCSLYPKGHLFNEHKFVRIWMAEGFFPPQEKITMEDFGIGCFQELVSRSFFQRYYSNDYKMHDLIHDLAQSISKGETYRLEDGKQSEIPTMLRHLNIMDTKDKKELMNFQAFNKLRTLIRSQQYSFYNFAWPGEFLNQNCSFHNSALTWEFLNRLQSIRTLILDNCELTEFPESIGDFIHLRYLSIYGNSKIIELPNSLFKLYSLQTLILASCDLHELPDSIGNLFCLRYLDISRNKNLNKLPESLCCLSDLQTLDLNNCYGLPSLPQGMSKLIDLRELAADSSLVSKITGVGKLTSLQSLSHFNVGKEHGRKLAELSDLTKLHGTLTIRSLENVESKEEAEAAKLQSKLHLDELELQWTENDAFSASEEVLEHLQPNSTLKKLTISGYRGARSPSWLQAESLSELETLCLKDCKRWDDLSLSEWFPYLNFLEINNCPFLNRLPLLPPSLETLRLERVWLTEFPGIQGMGGRSSNIATVSSLAVKISECLKLTTLDQIECFPCLVSLEIKNCKLFTRLPPLPPSLYELTLTEVGLTELPGIGGSSSNMTPSVLGKINIFNCPNLRSLDRIECFPCLEYLCISNCPSLIRLPPLPPSLVKLQSIDISVCPNLTSLDRIECLPCLGGLKIDNCPLLTRLPALPPSLEELALIQVGLTELPEIGESSSNNTTSSFSKVHIKECSDIISLEQGLLSCDLPKLAVIHVENCRELLRMQVKKVKEFTNLKYLAIDNCPKLLSDDDDDVHLLLPPSIKKLKLSNCGKVVPDCLHNHIIVHEEYSNEQFKNECGYQYVKGYSCPYLLFKKFFPRAYLYVETHHLTLNDLKLNVC